MSLAAEVQAVRTSIGMTDADHLACVRVGGPAAHELLDRVSPRPLFVRASQMLHGLLLADDATPLADAYFCCDEEDYLVVTEGMTGAAAAAYLRNRASGLDVQLEDLSPSHAFVSLDGPYAWELVAALTSPDVIGMPYLSFFHDGPLICFRAGKTGEYGYDLLIPRERLDATRARIRELGAELALAPVTLAAIDVCMLEAGFFNARTQVRPGLTPLELQLQWRVDKRRTFPGSEALAARRAARTHRVALIASEQVLAVDAPIELAGRAVGRVLDAAPSPTRGDALALALLELPLGQAGLAGFSSGGVACHTISAPAVNNRSLYVDPQRHAWATRDAQTFPPLVRPWWS